MQSAAHSYAVRNNVSDSQAWSELQSKPRDGRMNAGAKVSVGGGMLIKGEAHAGVEGTVSKGSQSSADERGNASTDHSRTATSQEMNDFRQGMDTLESYRFSNSSNHTDTASSGLLEQIGTTLSVADSQYQQYTNSMTRSHEYSEMASTSDTTSAQENSNYAQEFVGYVQANSPDHAEEVLTNTASPVVRAEREQLAGQFMEDKLRSRVEGSFDRSRASLSDGMGSVSNGVAQHYDADAYKNVEQQISQRSQAAGINDNQPGNVERTIQGAKDHINDNSEKITSGKGTISNNSESNQKSVESAKQKFEGDYSKAVKHQELSSMDNPKDVFEDAKKAKEKSDDNK